MHARGYECMSFTGLRHSANGHLPIGLCSMRPIPTVTHPATYTHAPVLGQWQREGARLKVKKTEMLVIRIALWIYSLSNMFRCKSEVLFPSWAPLNMVAAALVSSSDWPLCTSISLPNAVANRVSMVNVWQAISNKNQAHLNPRFYSVLQ